MVREGNPQTIETVIKHSCWFPHVQNVICPLFFLLWQTPTKMITCERKLIEMCLLIIMKWGPTFENDSQLMIAISHLKWYAIFRRNYAEFCVVCLANFMRQIDFVLNFMAKPNKNGNMHMMSQL